MSIERAKKALKGEYTDCIPLFDMPKHRNFLKKLTGIDPFENTVEAVTQAVHKLDIDMLMCSIPEQTLVDDKADNLYGLSTTKWRNKNSTLKDIFTYNPTVNRNDCSSLSEDDAYELFQSQIDRDRKLVGDIALPIGRLFTTCIHYAAEDLNWEEFLIACLLEEEKVSILIDSFQSTSERMLRAWAKTNIDVMLCHDDIAMSKGTVQSPDWLRKHVIPRYSSILKPVKDKGIPVIFMTDGNYTSVAKDLVEAGADGFFLDAPFVDLEKISSICGRDLIYFTGPSPALMTMGTPQEVSQEVARLAEVARELPRFFFQVPGGYTQNMPVENVTAYYESCRKYGQR